MQKRVRDVFDRIGKEMGSRAGESEIGEQWVKVDAGHEKDIVQGAIWELVEPLMNGVENPVAKLWEEYLPRPTSS